MRRLVLATCLAACSGSSSHAFLDAPREGPCLIDGTYGDLGAQPGMQNFVNGAHTLNVVLDPEPPRDELQIRLVAGRGVFAAGAPVPGTYTIGGSETSFLECGMCTLILADVITSGAVKFYATTAGTITLTSVDPIVGNAHDLQFIEVDPVTAAPKSDCAATISAIQFGS